LRDKHVSVNGSSVRFEFRGKSGRTHTIGLRNRKLAAIVKRCRDLPGYELFQYVDENGDRQTIDSADVNEYLREISGQDFTAKDFRTWAGTVLAARALKLIEPPASDTHAKKNLAAAVEAVAGVLGNTRSVCRKCYIHPAILDAYLEGSIVEGLRVRADAAIDPADDLRPDERAVLEFLRERLKTAASRGAAA
jgi:DNA topoisomerase-1